MANAISKTLEYQTLIKSIAEEYERSHFNAAAVARKFNLPANTVRNQLDTHYRLIGKPKPRTTANPPSPAPDTSDEVLNSRAREASLRAKLKASEEERRELKRIREVAFKLAPDQIAPLGWKLNRNKSKSKTEVPILFTSDHQVGEVIDPLALGGLNAYNLDIYRQRYRKLIADTINIIERHHGGAEHIIYLRGGDTISGGIHEDLAETEEAAPVQCIAAIEEETAGIKHLIDAFGRVTVISSPGNHDRTTRQPRSKNYTKHSFELLISYSIESQIESSPKYANKARFISESSGEVYFSLWDWTCLLTHGDRIGSRGGMGFIGPSATIMRGAKKTRDQYASVRAPIDFLFLGHFHYPMDVGEGVVVNNSLAGLSEYARDLRVKPQPPSQSLLFMHPDHGLTVRRTIYVESPKPRDAGLKPNPVVS
jgi:hypothetical protein